MIMNKKIKTGLIIGIIVIISLLILPNAIKMVTQTYLVVNPDPHSQEDYFDQLQSIETASAFMEKYPKHYKTTSLRGIDTVVSLLVTDWNTEQTVTLDIFNLFSDKEVVSIIKCTSTDDEKRGETKRVFNTQEIMNYECVDSDLNLKN